MWRAARYLCSYNDYPGKVINRPKLEYTIKSSDGPVSVDVNNSVVTFKLQNPETLNSLTHKIVKHMRYTIAKVQNDSDVAAFILESSGNIFCSGADFKQLYAEGVKQLGMKPDYTNESIKLRNQYFRDLYTLGYLIAKSKKPFVCLVGGSCVGAGIGLVTHASNSVATPLTKMKIPECSLGFFPHVGSGAFLGQIPRSVGLFFGLSGIEFNYEECNRWGIITNVVKCELDRIRKSIIDLGLFKEKASKVVTACLYFMSTQNKSFDVTIHESMIDHIELVYSLPSVEEIFLHLRERARKAFTVNLLHEAYCNMCKMSPTSLKVAHRYLKMAKNMSIEDCFKYEYRISQNFMRHPDFYEGIRASLIERDFKPKWSPKFLEDVSDEMVDKFFTLPDGCEDLDVVKEATFTNILPLD